MELHKNNKKGKIKNGRNKYKTKKRRIAGTKEMLRAGEIVYTEEHNQVLSNTRWSFPKKMDTSNITLTEQVILRYICIWGYMYM